MTRQFGSKSIAWLILAALALVLTACTSSYQASWVEVEDQANTTMDLSGEVLIVGGSIEGPSARGGQAQWTIVTDAGPVRKLAVTIYTNGNRWYGKGIHSTRPGGSVDIYVNDVLVHTIICDRRGEYDDYWPRKSPVGRSAYATGTIDVAGRGISGPRLTIKIVASPSTAVDVNWIEVSVVQDKK